MAGKKKNEILYVMADTETSNVPINSETNLETYAWLTGFKIVGLYDKISQNFDSSYKSELKYYYGKDSIKQLFKRRFNGVKGNITFKDIIKAEKTFKNIKRSPQDIINKSLKGKLEFTDLDNYRKVLHNIGIDDKTYNKLSS